MMNASELPLKGTYYKKKTPHHLSGTMFAFLCLHYNQS